MRGRRPVVKGSDAATAATREPEGRRPQPASPSRRRPNRHRRGPPSVRQLVVGTGGWGHGDIPTVRANSEVRNRTAFGVLKLTLHPSSYAWSFVASGGAAFTDAGRRPATRGDRRPRGYVVSAPSSRPIRTAHTSTHVCIAAPIASHAISGALPSESPYRNQIR
jgi:hypothetical protein